MKKYLSFLCCCLPIICLSQSINERLGKALTSLEQDAQFKHAAISLYVVETNSGKTVFEKNAQLGMAPASCQKVITSAAAFSLLGNDYRYKTKIYLNGTISNNTLNGGISIEGFGDPTLGSWRFESTKYDALFKQVTKKLNEKGIGKISMGVNAMKKNFEQNNIPGGWVWEDIGNYYGAGAAAINWHENQYDLVFQPVDKIGSRTYPAKFLPESFLLNIASTVTTAAKGSGDNAYIYFGLDGKRGLVTGTIPAGENDFKISGAVPDPGAFFEIQFADFLKNNNIKIEQGLMPGQQEGFFTKKDSLQDAAIFDEYLSPPLYSINYWFLKKSINLYGEAFVKTIAYEKEKFGSTEKGLEIIKDFWAKNGIEKSAINIKDGSGLSPSNRVTTNALVTVLQFAKKQSWFNSFYNALPEMNGIKMKDGYIGGVRSYTGFINSKSGTAYTFSFIVNNFDGSPGTVREKMWQVLSILK